MLGSSTDASAMFSAATAVAAAALGCLSTAVCYLPHCCCPLSPACTSTPMSSACLTPDSPPPLTAAAIPAHLDDGTDGLRRIFLRVAAALHDAVKQLPALAHLHHDVHVVLVLVRAAQRDDVGVSCKVMHDLHLPLHICDVLGRDQLALGDGLAGQHLACLLVCHEPRGAELALAQRAAKVVAAACLQERCGQELTLRTKVVRACGLM